MAFVSLFQINSPPFQFPFPLKASPCHYTFPWDFSPDLILAVSHQLEYVYFTPAPVCIRNGLTLSPQFYSQYYHLLTFQLHSDEAVRISIS